jgi:ParB family transcriptional regulator, chromosome partitioning protein
MNDEEDEGLRPLPDKLLTELTAYRTLALREALGSEYDMAFLAALHAVCLRLFYQYGSDSCLDIQASSLVFGALAPGLSDTPLAARVDARHLDWSQQLPAEPRDLWDALATFPSEARQQLFAHCVSLTVNAVHEPWSRRPRAIAHADRLATTLSLDVAATGWSPTVDNFLGRVTKARILGAVREAKGPDVARRLESLKKADMAREAEDLLERANWLPEPLRTPGHAMQGTDDPMAPANIGVEETVASDRETAMDEAALEEDSDQASDADLFGVAAE